MAAHQHAAVAPSNKPADETIKKAGKPLASLVLDKLSVTLHVTKDAKKNHIRSVLIDLPKIDGGTWIQVPRNGKRYKINVALVSHEGPFLFQADPCKSKDAFFRVEMNPAKLGSAGLERAKIVFGYLFDFGYLTFAQQARVSRIDVAVDIVGVKLKHLHVLPLYPTKTSVFFSAQGEPETIYYGLSVSRRQLRVYDKAAESLAKGHPMPHACTRIERVLKSHFPFRDIAQLGNIFRTFKLTGLSLHSLDQFDYVKSLFRLVVRLSGTVAALRVLPSPLRKEFRKALSASKPHWWNPDKIWQAWPGLIDELELLKPLEKGLSIASVPGVDFGMFDPDTGEWGGENL